MPGTIKDIPLRWCAEGVSQGNLALIDELFDENVTFSSPSIGTGKGLAAAKEYIAPFRSAFPDIRIEIDEALEATDSVVVRWKFVGHHRGDFMGVAATGRMVSVEGMTLLKVTNGKITEFHDYGDLLGMTAQIGVGPETAAANKALVRRYIDEFLNR